MKPFVPTKRKLVELLLLFVLAGVFFFFYPKLEGTILFVFGYIWNWSASIELDPMYEHRRYRFSMLSTVRNIQRLFLKPFFRFPLFVQKIISILPAGIFWWMVIFMNDSEMPWWSTFLGSAVYELLQIELNFIKDNKGQV